MEILKVSSLRKKSQRHELLFTEENLSNYILSRIYLNVYLGLKISFISWFIYFLEDTCGYFAYTSFTCNKFHEMSTKIIIITVKIRFLSVFFASSTFFLLLSS